MLNDTERIVLLEEARECLNEAIDLIKQAVQGTSLEDRAESYVLPSLTMCASDEHDYLGSQPCNIAEMIQALFDGDND